MKWYFAGDVHLSPGEGEKWEIFKEFFVKIKSESPGAKVVLLGDIFEFFSPLNSIALDAYTREMAFIEKMARDLEVIFVEGNHEFFLMPEFTFRWKIRFSRGPLISRVGPYSAYITHGDDLAMGTLPGRLFRRFMKGGFMKWLFKTFPDSWVYSAGMYFSRLSRNHSSQPSRKLAETMGKRAIKLLSNYDMVISGHVHSSNILNRQGRLYITVGSLANGEYFVVDSGKYYFENL